MRCTQGHAVVVLSLLVVTLSLTIVIMVLQQQSPVDPSTSSSLKCGEGQFLFKSLGVWPTCKTVTKCDLSTQFQLQPPTETADTVCKRLTTCKEGIEYEKKPPSATSDRICETVGKCVEGEQWQVQPATNTSDVHCVHLTTCDFTKQFESQAPTLTSDRKCEYITECLPLHYEIAAPTTSQNRQCVSYAVEFGVVEEQLKLNAFAQIPLFLNQQTPAMKAALLREVSQALPHLIVAARDEVVDNLGKRASLKVGWLNAYANFFGSASIEDPLRRAGVDDCPQCLNEFNSSLDRINDFFHHEVKKVEGILFTTKILKDDFARIRQHLQLLQDTQPVLASLWKAAAKLLDNNAVVPTNFYELALDHVEKAVKAKIDEIDKVTLDNIKTMENSESRRSYFLFLLSEMDLIAQLDNFLGHRTAKSALDSFNKKVKDLYNMEETILSNIRSKGKTDRNTATRFNHVYNNLAEISNLCWQEQFSHLNCKQDMQKLRAKVFELASTRIQQAVGNNNLPMISSALTFAQLMSHFITDTLQDDIRSEIGTFLSNSLPVELGLNLHNVLTNSPTEGLGTEIVQQQEYFSEVELLIITALASKDPDTVLAEMGGTDLTHISNLWKYTTNKMLQMDSRSRLRRLYFDSYKRELDRLIKPNEKGFLVFLNGANELKGKKDNILKHLKTHVTKSCLKGVTGEGNFNKDCVPKAIAMLSSLWSLRQKQRDVNQLPLKMYYVKPYPAQIFTIFRLLGLDDFSTREVRGHLAEVKTGEGKSLDLALTASFLALVGSDAHIVCYSPYLSSRDATAFKDFYAYLGIEDKVHYQTIDQLTEFVVTRLGGNVREFVEKGFTDVTHTQQNQLSSLTTTLPLPSSLQNSYLLIDEVDVFFNKRFYGNSYTIGALVQSGEFKALAMKIWAEKDNPSFLVTQSKEYLLAESIFTTAFDYPPEILQSAAKKMQFDVKQFGTHSYVVQDGKIGYVDLDTFNFNLFYPYMTLFAYIFEHEKNPALFNDIDRVASLRLAAGRFSYAEIPSLFKAVLGVSGTLADLSETEKETLKEDYGIERVTLIPSMFAPSKLDFLPLNPKYVKVVEDADFNMELLHGINEGLQGNTRSVIVVFDTFDALRDFYESSLYTLRDQTAFFTEKSDEDARKIMPTRTNAGQITFITRAFGRGVDFSCYDNTVNKRGGVFLLQTFMSTDPSEELQIQGRTARQGQPGSYRLILKKGEELIGRWGWEPDVATQCMNTGDCYMKLKETRISRHLTESKDKKAKALALKPIHQDSLKFLEAIRKSDVDAIKVYLAETNDFFVHAKQQPDQSTSKVHTVFALDSSGSMYGMPWKQLVEGVKFFLHKSVSVGALDDIVTFIIYDHQVEKVFERMPIKDALDQIDTILHLEGGGTEFGPAIVKAQEVLSAPENSDYYLKFMFLSDGNSNTGGPEMTELGKELGPKGLQTFVVAFGGYADVQKLKDMATLHGHNAVFLQAHLGDSLDRPNSSGPLKKEVQSVFEIVQQQAPGK